MDSPVRILVFDDDVTDAELICRSLRRHNGSFQMRHVCTEREYMMALRSFLPHIILSDYKLPLYGGVFALQMACELCPQVPFILVSGVLQDGLATELLKRGARAFVSKGNLKELGPTVDQALNAAAADLRGDIPAAS